MKFGRSPLIAVLALLTVAGLAQAQSLSTDLIGKIEKAISEEQKKQGIPGLSVAVVVDGKKVWEGGFGLSDLENQVPAKATTTYRLASISKSLTAVAAMRLFEQGKLDLDAPVRTYVPEWPEKHVPVSLRQLLGHLGGLRHYKGAEIDSTTYYGSLAKALDIFKDDPLLSTPGTQYSYTTYGFTLIGCALEKAAGKTFAALMKDLVFEPAGMATIRVDRVADIIPNRAQGYRKGPLGTLMNSGLADTSYKIPGGGFCSTAGDLADFAAALMNGALLKPESRELMWTSQKTSDGKETGYGMGFGVGKRNGFRVISHSGGQQRVATLLWIVPEKKLAVAVMTNMEGASPGAVVDVVAALLDPELARNGG